MWRAREEAREEVNSIAADVGVKDNIVAFVGNGVEVKATINYKGTVKIDGHFEGEINTDGVLLVGEEAVLQVQVNAGTVVSHGKIIGNIRATEKINLMAPAILEGSIKTPVASIEEGVLFTGHLEMVKETARAPMSEEVDSQSGKTVTPIGVTRTPALTSLNTA